MPKTAEPTKDAFSRVAEIKEDIARLENESQAIIDAAASESRDPTDDQNQRLTEIMGEDRTGTHPECEMAVSYDRLKNWEQIIAGIREREKALTELRPEVDANAERAMAVTVAPPREFPMGASKAVIVPLSARAPGVKLGPEWGESRREREEQAYAAGMWFIAKIWPHHEDGAHLPITQKAREWCREHGILGQQQTGDDPKGGYLVPKPLESAVIEIRERYGVFRRNARRYPMSSKTLDIPKFQDGLTVGLLAELAVDATPTEKVWEQVNLVAKKAFGHAIWSTEVAEDAVISLAADLARDFGIAFATREDFCGFMADGTVDAANMGITGITNALLAGSTYTLGGGKTSVDDIILQDYEKLIGMIPNTTTDLHWFMNKSVYYASIHPMKTAQGGNTIATLTDGDPLTSGGDFRFLGIEGSWVNSMPQASAAGPNDKPVILGDLSRGVAFGERRGVTIKVSDVPLMTQDAVLMTASSRFDIQVHETGGASDAGVIVQMQLAAA